MKKLAVLLILIMVWIVKADVGCMYGWRLSDDARWCEKSCKDYRVINDSNNGLNVYCKIFQPDRHAIFYNATSDTLITARGRSLTPLTAKLPSCFNVTFKEGTFNVTPNGVIRVANYYFVQTSNFYIVNNSLTICYPLSPQLLQCPLQETLPNEFHVKDGVELVIPSKNFSALLGDFYINDDEIAFTCAKTIRKQMNGAPRCNYVYLNLGEYVILKNGSMLIRLSGFIINNPLYSVVISHVTRVCIPLSFELLNCPHNLSQTSSYIFNRDLSAAEYNDFDVFQPDDEFLDADGKLHYCSASSVSDFQPVSVVIYIYLITCIVASLVIFSTVVGVVVKWKLLVTNNHMLCMLFHVLFLLLVYIEFMINRLYTPKNTWQCYLLFAINYFSNISTMTWLNVVLFDMWQNFYRLNRNNVRQKFIFERFGKTSKLLFTLYSIYAFGLTSVLLMVILVVDFSPDLCAITFGVCPHLRRICWFNSVDAYIIFYAVPYTVLTMINLVFLILTIHVLQQATIDTEFANPLCKKQMKTVTIKLLVLSCFCYVVTTVSFIIDAINTSYFIYSTLIYDAVMIGQGIAIFVIYYQKHLLKNFFKKA